MFCPGTDYTKKEKERFFTSLFLWCLYSDVFPLCLVQPPGGFGSHLYPATLRPLRSRSLAVWSYGLTWVTLFMSFASLPHFLTILYHKNYDLSSTFFIFLQEVQAATRTSSQLIIFLDSARHRTLTPPPFFSLSRSSVPNISMNSRNSTISMI